MSCKGEPCGITTNKVQNVCAADDSARLEALRRYNILDTDYDPRFDDLAELGAFICDTPIAVINFIDKDRQWFKSEIGLGIRETELDISVCAHAILQPGLFVVPDMTKDPRFVKIIRWLPANHIYAFMPAHCLRPTTVFHSARSASSITNLASFLPEQKKGDYNTRSTSHDAARTHPYQRAATRYTKVAATFE